MATKPEQSRTRPATVTARKLLEANSSRMVHRLPFAPLLEQNDCHFAQSKGFPSRRPVSTRGDDFMQHPLERGTYQLGQASRAPAPIGRDHDNRKSRTHQRASCHVRRLWQRRDHAPRGQMWCGDGRLGSWRKGIEGLTEGLTRRPIPANHRCRPAPCREWSTWRSRFEAR
jgi:hypothetical protein